ncbi:hypothetical protein [Novosphingobium sp. Leaf2]|uniref:hypothetical protein n=1 Tax=Novosphingobium sp. Leaf2 TaxID=1735670 RepID=UPI0007015543|nr:hypothetical protein [Novosphingobium sp. Leaf2]KQM19352.1 hypothetical protein ASE49_03665 [Novosphingobium sp. Leaf2]
MSSDGAALCKVVQRRRGNGAAACGGDDSASSVQSPSCIADPAETNGPYPADGANTASEATSNVLAVSGIVGSNIRSSFINSTTTADGVPLALTLQLVNVTNSCAPIAGVAVIGIAA